MQRKPTLYTAAEQKRMQTALERSDEENARRLRIERIARLACFAIVIFIAVAMFYSCTGPEIHHAAL